MSPLITFYILAGMVGLAVLVFLVMIVVTALRPPELPDLHIEPRPLDRMIRALTPLPFATTTPMPANRPTPVPVMVPAPPSIATAPAAPTAAARSAVAPRAAAPHVPVVAAPQPPVVVPSRSLSAQPRVGLDRSGEIRRPIYPHRRSRTLGRILIGLFVALTLASGTIIAVPSVIDPLCDDYEWFGAEAANVVRHYACDAHNAIYELVEDL
jgi:hypothetical protein